MRLWRIFLLLLFVVFPFGQLARINLIGSEVVIHANDISVGLFVSSWFFLNRKILPGILKEDLLTKPMAILIGAMFLSLLVNFSQYSLQHVLISILYPIRFMLYAGLYFVIKNLPETEKKLAKFGFIYAVLAVAVIGLIQYVVMPDVSFFAAAAWDDHFYRLVFPFMDPGFTGVILVLGMLAIYNLKINLHKYLRYGGLAIVFVAMMLTYSRASYLIYLLGFAVVSWYQKSLKIFLIAVVVFLVALPLLPKSPGEGTKLERESSITARLNNWKESIVIWQTRPIFGVGFDAYRYARGNINPESHSGAGADSSTLLILATTGIVGFLAYLYFLKTILVVKQGETLIIASLIAIFVHSWFDNTLFYPWVMELLFIIIGSSPRSAARSARFSNGVRGSYCLVTVKSFVVLLPAGSVAMTSILLSPLFRFKG